MNAKVFVDTNVFIYLQSTTDSEKRIMSQIERSSISLSILNFYLFPLKYLNEQ